MKLPRHAEKIFDQFPWAEQLTSIRRIFSRKSIAQQTVRFDLIISNPPYYQQKKSCATPQREQARYTTTLDHPSLLTCAAK
ncbi:Eco57I restriction-modification methylase domain-containing protein [Escherichia coli]